MAGQLYHSLRKIRVPQQRFLMAVANKVRGRDGTNPIDPDTRAIPADTAYTESARQLNH